APLPAWSGRPPDPGAIDTVDPASRRHPFTAGEVVFEYALDLFESPDLVELLPERPAVLESLRIPAEVLPELDHRPLLVPLEGDGVPRVLDDHGHPLEHPRLCGDRPPLQRGARLREDPRTSVGTPRDHDPRTPRVLDHSPRILARPDIPIPDDRDVQRLHHSRDLVPVGPPRVHLRPRPRVQRQHLRTRFLTPERDLHRIA